ncbi:root phototropism protein 3-like [Trifolium pratense]|uniref:root phototropism protein 3-like n=1 Tax=Trifolium pratense TaxID=57577 RepID=UPI001E697C0B|nr:root phototropism protein 3-like [Trifolium pratense]
MKILDCERVLDGGKRNRCVVLPANVPMVADSLKRKNQNWIARANSANDLIIQVGDSSFHLHKLAMVSRSEYLNRLVFKKRSNIEENTSTIEIDNIPGGRKTFELVIKFCYGWKFDMTPSNIASLYCAANFLEMSEDIEKENLISKTESFLTFLMLSSWKDTFRILKSCESISHWAKELQLVKRCSETIAWKACAIEPNNPKLEDVSLLRIDYFIEVIQSMKIRGMKAEIVGSCIENWTIKWFSNVTLGLNRNVTDKHTGNQLIQLHKVSTECLIKMLPTEENSVSCNFLLHLLKAGMMLKINHELLCVLERRVVSMLEKCCVQDLLVKNQGDHKDSLYDVDVVIVVLQCYVLGMSSDSAAKVHTVGRLVDGYLSQVARDQMLKVESFKLLVEVLPQNARECDDNLYKVIDMYLKAHPYLTEEDRENVCSILEYHRLSQEARQHVMKNDRLPLKLSTGFVLLEQVSMSWTVASKGSNYQRTKTQTSMRVSKDFENIQMSQEIKVMRKDVEMMKSQLLELNTCKTKLQKQMKICTR